MVNSVLKAIDILQVFSSAEPRLSLGEISRRLDLPKSTTHNLINTLAMRGFIEKTDDGVYALGSAIIKLTQSVRLNAELRDRAAPLMRQLADTCRTSVYLAVPDGDYVLYIYAVESPQRLLARTAVGDLAHLHSTAVGKAILSVLPKQKVNEIINRAGMPQITNATITDPRVLQEKLALSQERGYALDHSENERETYCIGTPIFDHKGQVIAACSLSGTDPEIVGDRQPNLSKHLLSAAQELSRRMGYVPARRSAVTIGPSIVQTRGKAGEKLD